MKRRQLFEFEDARWFPALIRGYMTSYLRSLHRIMKTDEVLAPLVERCLSAAGTREIVDLCSGSGGPIPDVARRLSERLGEPVKATLTDLYPSPQAMERIAAEGDAQVRYHPTSVDAGNVPDELSGARTMVCAFHHMPPEVATRILRDSFTRRRALCVFEISDNSQPRALWWLPIPIGIVLVLLLTPFTRPRRLGQLVLTYLIPILPLLIAWDGAVSNARTYTRSDLETLIARAELTSPDYEWVIDTVKKKGNPGTMLYLLGLPRGGQQAA